MNLTSADWPRLRNSLLLCLALVAGGAAALFAVLRSVAAADQANHQAQLQRAEVRQRLASGGAEAAALRARIDRYREIEARGIIGTEQRLEWVERLAAIEKSRRLGAIRYELAVQKPAPLPGGSTSGGYEFMASTMKLQLPLLHEEDLLGFLADLGAGVAAWPRVRACNVERIADATAGGANLRADCTIDWITLRATK